MLARADTVAMIAESWLARFEAALAAPGRPGLERLFHADSHWRDVLALTWHIKTVSGSDAIVRELATHAGRARPTGFKIDLDRRSPRAIKDRYADRRPRSAHRRQLAQALSRIGPAQPGARQPPAVHALSAKLADLHSQRQAGRLVRGLCGKLGVELLDRHRIRRRQLRRKSKTMVRCAASGRRHAAADAPAPRRDGHRRERHSEPSGYSELAQLRRYSSALQSIRRRRGMEGQERSRHRLGQQRP